MERKYTLYTMLICEAICFVLAGFLPTIVCLIVAGLFALYVVGMFVWQRVFGKRKINRYLLCYKDKGYGEYEVFAHNYVELIRYAKRMKLDLIDYEIVLQSKNINPETWDLDSEMQDPPLIRRIKIRSKF